jgi:tetratricopeptide (TPR) repeat protein
MHNMKKLAWLLPVLLPLSQPAWPDDLISSQMADEARMWQQKDRDDLAATIWRKLLSTNPRHSEALVRLGMIEARSGNIAEAEALYARARRLSPSASGLTELGNVLEAKKNAGKRESRPAVPATTPAGQATATSAQPAAGASSTASAKATAPVQPATPTRSSEPEAQPKTETEGRKTAQEVSKSAPSAKSAEPAARKQTTGTQISLDPFQATRAANGKWGETRQKLEELVRKNNGAPQHLFALARHLTYRDTTRREGIRQLASLPAGLRNDAETRKVWREALIALDPRASDGPLFAAYLDHYPGDAAIAARMSNLPQTAMAGMSDSGAPNRPSGVPAGNTAKPYGGGPNKEQVAALLRAALSDEQSGANGSAARRLENAMLLDPADPTIRIMLARQYEHMGALKGAANLLDGVLVAFPDMSNALHARARLFVTQQQWLDGLNLLERVPVTMRTAELAQTQRQLWAGAQVLRARQLYRKGDTAQASAILEKVETEARGDEVILALAAGGWGENGQPAKGLSMMRGVLSRATSRSIPLRIQYAELLLLGGQDGELSAVLRDIAVPGRLNAAQQETVNGIIFSYTLRLAESLREAGRLGEATAMLAPILQRTEDPRALTAMARIHRAASYPQRALPLVEKAIVRDPQDVGFRLLASELAISAKEMDKAEFHAAAALELAPNHPRTISAMGRVQRFNGNTAKALEYFQRAYALEYDVAAFNGTPSHLMLRLASHEQLPGTALPGPIPGAGGLLPIPDPSKHVPASRTDLLPSAAMPPVQAPVLPPPVSYDGYAPRPHQRVTSQPFQGFTQPVIAPVAIAPSSPVRPARPAPVELQSMTSARDGTTAIPHRESPEAATAPARTYPDAIQPQHRTFAYGLDGRISTDPAFEAVYGPFPRRAPATTTNDVDEGIVLKLATSLKLRGSAKTNGRTS